MEYLNNIDDPLLTINETGLKYIDILKRPDLVWGTEKISGNNVDFLKYNYETEKEISYYSSRTQKEFYDFNKAATGCRIRFKTNSKRIIIKAELRREWDYAKMNLWTSSGFDVYETVGEQYIHRIVFAPKTGEKIFAEKISGTQNGICIFLPLYNEVKKLYIGIEENTDINSNPYPDIRPIIFYGNSITQGASASRSSNCFCNIVSRQLNSDIINFSISSCCKGLRSVADIIGRINCKAIIVDYSRNAYNAEDLKKNHENFYLRLRKWHPHIPIIILTVANFHNWEGYIPFDKIIADTYTNAVKNGDNTFLINQTSLFNRKDYDLVTIDGIHYTDYGMFQISDSICKVLREYYE